VGSAETVRRTLTRQVEISGANFVGGNFVFGDMSFDEASRSIRLFAEQVMPPLRTTAKTDAVLA
jgi:hypothetical protein